VIATPGHMPGHISIYLKETKTLIAGDAMVVENGKLTIANPQYTLDMQKAKESISKLLSYEIETVLCYHGGIYSEKIEDALELMIS
jgi:glyoxylase-like metal-dependent hydrolase (beta-lactamase superfamily II)